MSWLSRLFGKKKFEPAICNQSPRSSQNPNVTPRQPWELYRTFDSREAKKISKLHPELAKRTKALLYLARKEGLPVYIFEGERTWARQKSLYAKGRKNGKIYNKKLVVTYARPGSSYHNYALAVDIVFDGDTKKPGVQWSWKAPDRPQNASRTYTKEELDRYDAWKRLGAIGTSCGLEWAGVWKRFPEYPHFGLVPPTINISKLKKWYKKGGLKLVWKKIDEKM